MKEYTIEQALGSGGQGETTLATDPETGQKVVVKRLGFEALGTWKDWELFEREISILGDLDHPNIPKLLDYENDGQTLTLVYEYVEGDTLNELLEAAEPNGIFDDEGARNFLRQMLEVLTYLQSRRPPVVHRDIKPSNIVACADGRYCLIDFGAAQSATRLTSGSTFVGTNGYMAPEQLMGRAEPRSDLYSLGATTLQLLTGLHPSLIVGEGLRFNTSEHLNDAMCVFVDLLTHPLPEQRFEDAKSARIELDKERTALIATAPGDVRVARTAREVSIEIPRNLTFLLLCAVLGIVGAVSLLKFSAAASLAVAVSSVLYWWWSKSSIVLTRTGATFVRGFGLPMTHEIARDEVLAIEEYKNKNDKLSSHLVVQKRDGTQKKFARGLNQASRDYVRKTVTDHMEIA